MMRRLSLGLGALNKYVLPSERMGWDGLDSSCIGLY
jgi:hypothetical protein